ncbi:molybdenum cofactor guanylyltransferase MobA [Imhoffiella purpurea]|uniref:Molybdenum cofactor guanylyltransferase n=1 Tax=Imhoffiella purpurea TaxID=1249627 RepID=W9V9N9_9GAMM|nr:molybdenum cofactor guanylyltransferase MobA [Imhoffiella purpurea]EXJ13606.1 Molybdopterin-guanine dinucleotide biosynthesis protein MobA [Imhoffiella purpurea]
MTLVPDRASTTGVILAGGRARRMDGQDKGLIRLAGRPLIEWAIEALEPQVGAILISANRNLDRYASYGHPVVSDPLGGFQGPLAGCLAAMRAARTPWILTLPCDAPLTPRDLRTRLAETRTAEQTQIAICSDGTRRQQLHALISVALADDLQDFLSRGERKAAIWQHRHRPAVADFGDQSDAFANLNERTDLSRLERLLAAGSGSVDASRSNT